MFVFPCPIYWRYRIERHILWRVSPKKNTQCVRIHRFCPSKSATAIYFPLVNKSHLIGIGVCQWGGDDGGGGAERGDGQEEPEGGRCLKAEREKIGILSCSTVNQMKLGVWKSFYPTVKRRVKNLECFSTSIFSSLFIIEDYSLAHSFTLEET